MLEHYTLYQLVCYNFGYDANEPNVNEILKVDFYTRFLFMTEPQDWVKMKEPHLLLQFLIVL